MRELVPSEEWEGVYSGRGNHTSWHTLWHFYLVRMLFQKLQPGSLLAQQCFLVKV